jgi:hypothetical protein
MIPRPSTALQVSRRITTPYRNPLAAAGNKGKENDVLLFDPTKIVTFISLAAAAFLAICYVRDAKRRTQSLTLIVTLVALSLAACLEW